VALVAPEPESPWQPNYCLWADELPAGMEELVERRWSAASVFTSSEVRNLQRAYVKLDTRGLQSFHWHALRAGSARVVSAPATHLEHRAGESRIHTDDGSAVRARVVVDASGAGSPFIQRAHRRAPAFQTAFGLMLHAPAHGFDPMRMVLMDYRSASSDASDPPSFLYVLPMSDDRLFVEETSLASRPAMGLDVLRVRLETRLASLGLDRCERVREEHCSIPMGLGLPVPGQAMVAFGAAGAMVHPASGYLMAHVLRKANLVAASIIEGLDAGDTELAIASANAAVWPRAHRTTWELYAFCLETLVGMDSSDIAQFFDSFFQLPLHAWSGFLGGNLAPAELGTVMARLFCTLPPRSRWHLVRKGLSDGAAPLARSLLQSDMT
jgi:lycopene cyclase-like protein